MPTLHITIKIPVLIDTPACNKQNAHQDFIEPSRGISSCQIICPAAENPNKTQSHSVDGVIFVGGMYITQPTTKVVSLLQQQQQQQQKN